MALKDLFKKNEEKEERPVNPNALLGIRALAVGYLIYCLWQIVKMYMEGGEEAPSVWLLILAIVVLGGGAVWIAIMTFLKLKELKEQERARLDEEDAEQARLAESREEEETDEEEAEAPSEAEEEDQQPE